MKNNYFVNTRYNLDYKRFLKCTKKMFNKYLFNTGKYNTVNSDKELYQQEYEVFKKNRLEQIFKKLGTIRIYKYKPDFCLYGCLDEIYLGNKVKGDTEIICDLEQIFENRGKQMLIILGKYSYLNKYIDVINKAETKTQLEYFIKLIKKLKEGKDIKLLNGVPKKHITRFIELISLNNKS